jgi:predicted N-acyltransferase
MKLKTVSSLADIDPHAWNALAASDNPFVQHEFLLALEKHHCLEPWGWQPHYILAYDSNSLAGACPAYIKHNSYGEFVFDWAWADAYQRNGLEYYPKLVIAAPFTPAFGPRLLTGVGDDKTVIRQQLIQAAIETVDENSLSGAHWLFCDTDDREQLQQAGMLMRSDFQYHWSNNGYRDFDHFLAHLNSKKRKNIRRERRKVSEANITTEIIRGDDLDEEQWRVLYDFYRITFLRKSGAPTLSLEFFQAMSHRLRAIFARHRNRIVAGAICFESSDTLYGRHWGCYEDYDSLHFEVCYYSGIDYCIRQGLQRFEPGAQGEHKIARGFMPTRTWSAHWIAHEGFRQAIRRHLEYEASAMDDYYQQLLASQPYRQREL